MDENNITLVGAVHDFTCPESGKNYMFFLLELSKRVFQKVH